MIMTNKKANNGFTLVELMVVVFIVAILAAVAIPICKGKVDKAKWSEAKAMMGTIAVAIRGWCAEDGGVNGSTVPSSLTELGFSAGDCTGSFFSDGDYSSITITSVDPPEFSITCTPTTQPDRPSTPESITMITTTDGGVVWE